MYHLLKKVSCKECFTVWFVCTECKKRFSTRKYSLGVRHFKTMHANITMYENDDNADYVIEDDMRNSGNSSQNENSYSLNRHACRLKSISASGISGDVSLSNMSDQSKRYFTDDMENKGAGIRALVGLAITKNIGINAHHEEALYHMDVAKFCSKLNIGQQKQFARIMKRTHQKNILSTQDPPCL